MYTYSNMGLQDREVEIDYGSVSQFSRSVVSESLRPHGLQHARPTCPSPTPRSDQIRSVAQSCPTLCNPMNRSTPGLSVHHRLPELTEIHVH